MEQPQPQINIKLLEEFLRTINSASRSELNQSYPREKLLNLYNAWNSLEEHDKKALEGHINPEYERPTRVLLSPMLTTYRDISTNPETQIRFAQDCLVKLMKTTQYQKSFLKTIKSTANPDADQSVADVEETPFYQALIPSFSQEDAAAFVKKLSYYSTNNPIVYILGCLFVAFVNILHILFDINELRDAILLEEYRWSGELAKKIENFFKIIRILLKYLYIWIKCDSIVSCLRQWGILFLIIYYPPGSWMISIICKFILCFTGIDIKLQLTNLAYEVYYAGVDITNFFCAIYSAFESLNFNTQQLTNVAKTMAPAIKDAVEAIATSGELVASTGQQLASTGQQLASAGQQLTITGQQLTITGQQLVITNEILASTFSAAKNDFVTALIEFKGQLLPLLATASVGATCQIPDSLKSYLVEQSSEGFTSLRELKDQLQAIHGRVQELGDSQLDLQQIRSEMIRLGYSTPSSFDSVLELLGSFAGNLPLQILLNSRQLQHIFSNRPTQRAIEYGGRKTRKYRKNYKNKTKIYRKKQTHKRYRKKIKKGKKSKKY